MKVLVCGGRDFDDSAALHERLRTVEDVLGPVTAVIHGCARGADTLAAQWARLSNVREIRFPANWKKHGKAAGPIRNQQMLDQGQPDLVVAVAGGRGTRDMVTRAHAEGVRIYAPEWGYEI